MKVELPPELLRIGGALQEWFNHERSVAAAAAAASAPDGRFRLLLGTMVYGPEYVRRFLYFCVPSLLAPGNVRALPDPTIIIHTDAASAATITAAVECGLTSMATVEVHIIPQYIIDAMPDNGSNKYWLLSTTGHIHMQQAKYRGHGYHMLMPDHVYAMGYFANVARLRALGHLAIAQGGLSAEIDAVAPELLASKGAVTPTRLAELAVDNMHRQARHFLMNGRPGYPKEHLLILIGRHAAYVVSPHMTPVMIDNQLLQSAPQRLFNTMDTQLMHYIPPDVEPYMPGLLDGMTYIELSSAEKPDVYGQQRDTSAEFCARFWVHAHCDRSYEKLFGLTTVFPFGRAYVPPLEPIDDEAIAVRLAVVRQAVANSHMVVAEAEAGEAEAEVEAVVPHTECDPLSAG